MDSAPLSSFRRAYTEHLGQLTGTALSPLLEGMKGTDLGASFVQEGRVVLLFGDTLSDDPALMDVDYAASAPLELPSEGPPKLTWLGPLAPPGLPLGAMGTPTDGFAVGEDTYVFFVTRFDDGARTHQTSALARTRGLVLGRLEVLHEAPATHFANVSALVEGEDVFVYGAGAAYRRSPVRLARVPLDRLADRAAWDVGAAPIIDAPHVGEISVRRHPRRALYLMAFNCRQPRGVSLYLADSPAGPWRAAGRLYDPSDGYERFIHAQESHIGYDDGLAPGAEDGWGDEYGPYLATSWFVEDGDALGVVYTLSSWNPYQVHLMRTWLVSPGLSYPRPVRGRGAPPPRIASDGTFRMNAEAAALRFTIHGRRGRVLLHRGRDVLRCSCAPGLFRRRAVRWNLVDHRGETLRLEVDGADARGLVFE